MTSSDSPDAPQKGLARFFGRSRKAQTAEGTSSQPGEIEAAGPQSMRLRMHAFETKRVADVMVPRAEMKAVDATTSFDDLVRFFGDMQHSRLPVFRETLDDPIGFVHIKDVMAELAKPEQTELNALERLHREVLFVPPSMRIADLLLKMQTTRIHLAIVVDEYGGTDGLVTLEDLVEEIVGNIEDEHDDDGPLFVRRTPRVWDADARTYVEDFTAATGCNLMLSDMEEDIDTLGGVAAALAGKVPARGEVLRHPAGVDIEIIEADARRIRRLRLRLPDETSAPPAANGPST
jgi:CBS domain containing-hemolysin-like protein